MCVFAAVLKIINGVYDVGSTERFEPLYAPDGSQYADFIMHVRTAFMNLNKNKPRNSHHVYKDMLTSMLYLTCSMVGHRPTLSGDITCIFMIYYHAQSMRNVYCFNIVQTKAWLQTWLQSI